MSFLKKFDGKIFAKSFILGTAIASPFFILNYPVRCFVAKKIYCTDTPLSDHLEQLINQVNKEQNLNLKNVEFHMFKKIRPRVHQNFSIFGKNLIFLPEHFNYENFNDVKAKDLNEFLKQEYNLMIEDKNLWITDYGKKLILSFLLSDIAKKFAIARQIRYLEENTIFTKYFIWSITVSLFLSFTFSLSRSLKYIGGTVYEKNLKKIRIKYRIISRILHVVICATLLRLLLSIDIIKNDRNVNALTLSKGKENDLTIKTNPKAMDFNYYAGGNEYFTKYLDRNLALYNLLNLKDKYIFLRKFDEKGIESLKFYENASPVTILLENINNIERLKE